MAALTLQVLTDADEDRMLSAQAVSRCRLRDINAARVWHYNLGVSLQTQGKLDEAIAHLRRVLEFMPGTPEIHCQLALALKRAGQDEEAERQMRLARGATGPPPTPPPER
jgi:Flp pilus assembly protein TadD